MTIQSNARRGATRPVAAGLLIALAGPILGLCPFLALSALAPGVGEAMVFGSGPEWTVAMAYALTGIPSLIAGVLAALTIRKDAWIDAPHWRAVTGILALAWITLLGMYVKFQPASLLLTVILYVIAAAIFASWALRLMITRLRWMRQPAREIFRVVH